MIKHVSSFVHVELFTILELKGFTLVLQVCVKTLWGIQNNEEESRILRTNRCKFHASQTSAVFLTCRVEFVAAVKMHVQLQAKIHGVLLKQFFSWFIRLSLNGFVRFSLKIREKQRAFAIQLLL